MEKENIITKLLTEHNQKKKADFYFNTKIASQLSYIKVNHNINLPWEIIYFYTHFNIEDDIINSILYSDLKNIKIFYNQIFIEYCIEKWTAKFELNNDSENILENILTETSYNFNIKNDYFEDYNQTNFLQKCYTELNSDSDLCFSIGLEVTSDCGGSVYLLLNGYNAGYLTTDFGHEQINHKGIIIHYSPIEEKNTWHCLKMYEELIANSLK